MKRAQRTVLEPEGIVRAALGVLDEVGLEDLSMRRLADVLGVQNPALYWHVRNKQDLINRMAQVLLTEGFAAAERAMPKPRSWAKKLERFACGLRDAMRSRKDGARLVAAANLSQQGSALFIRIDALVGALKAEGFRVGDALRGVLTVIHYTLGTTFEEQSDPRHGDPTMPPDASLPALAVLAEMRDAGDLSRVDTRFEFGVALIVEGLRARPRARGKGRRGQR